jgi:ATP-binding cassette subfamily B protein
MSKTGKKGPARQSVGAIVRRLSKCLPDKKMLIWLVIIALVGSNIFVILAPIITQYITDSIATSVWKGRSLNFNLIGQMLALLAALYVASAALSYYAARKTTYLAQLIIQRLREQIQLKLNRVTINYVDQQNRGDLLSRVTNDATTLSSSLERDAAQMLTQGTTIVGIVVMMVIVNVPLSLIFLVVIPLTYGVMRLITKKTRVLFRRQQEELGKLNGIIEEVYEGHLVVKSFNYEAKAGEKFDEVNQRFFKSYLDSRFYSGLATPIIKLLNNLAYIGICVIGGVLVIRGSFTVGGIQAFLIYANNITSPLSQMSNSFNQVLAGVAAAERIFDFLDGEEEAEEEAMPGEVSAEAVASELGDGTIAGAEPKVQAALQASSASLPRQELVTEQMKGHVVFKNVEFGYLPEKILFHDVSLEARPGEIMAVVGPSGAGKTTLVNLLLRFYEINRGQIILEEIDTQALSRDNLRGAFGMVFQDTWLFSGTVAENIAYGKKDATRDEVVLAAQKAQADSFIRRLPEGYDTMIGGDLAILSEGECQLLAIARTILADPKILILDEATSSVDTRTEILITQAMEQMMKNRTTFIIAHRLFTIKNADKIIFMKDGDIKEVGSHQELLAKKGLYAGMYNSAVDQ